MSMGLMPFVTQSSQGASQSYSKITPDISTKPEKTIGGALSSGAGAGVTGYMVSGGNPVGAGIGAVIGLAAYYLS